MLSINNLHVKINNNQILKGINLEVNPGELHVIMGPNGSGKSTLANVLAGRESHSIVKGSIQYNNNDLLEMSIEKRACEGIFLSFQYPVVIPGVNNMYFLKESLNAQRKYHGMEELDSVDFLDLIKENLKVVELDERFIHRSVNEGFSGGEKKRGEILQMLVMKPTLMLLDEPDSGLDVDALKVVADGINYLRDKERSIILVTHYQRILSYIVPDFVHVLLDGKIVSSGGPELAEKVESQGYDWLRESTD